MADDILLDFLHMEFVSLFDEMNGEEKVCFFFVFVLFIVFYRFFSPEKLAK